MKRNIDEIQTLANVDDVQPSVSVLKFISASKLSEVMVEDESGNSVLIPSKGSADVVEYSKVLKLFYESQQNPLTALQIETDTVATCLRHRFKIAKNVTDESILSGQDGLPLPVSLVKVLFQFFIKELQLEEAINANQGQGLPKRALKMEDAAPYIDR